MAYRCFEKLVAELLTDALFETVSIVPYTYFHPQRDIDTVVHGDDFVAVAEDGQSDHFEQFFENSMEIQRVGRIGPDRSSMGKSAQAWRQLEWRRRHLGGGSEVDGEVDQHAELDGRKGSVDPWWQRHRERRSRQ